MKKLQKLLEIIFTIVFIIGFMCMIFLDVNSSHWFKNLLIYFLLVLVGLLGAYICERPIILTKHIAAIVCVVSAFMFNKLKLYTDIGHKSNILRKHLGGYIYLYSAIEDKFEDKYGNTED